DAKRESGYHPKESQAQRMLTQIHKQAAADHETDDRQEKVKSVFLCAVYEVPHKRRSVDAHKRNQRAEIEQADALLKCQEKRPDQHDHTNQNYVVPRNAVLFIHNTKKRFRQRVAPTHSIEQPRRTDLRSHAGTEICNKQSETNNLEKWRPRPGRRENIRQILVRKGLSRGPNQLRDINFRGREYADEETSANGRNQDISLWVFCFLRQRRNSVESNVRQYREGCAPEEVACCERSGIVERPREK